MNTSAIYQIKIKEQLDDRWSEWFWPLVIQRERNGGTTLVGELRDQAELHGILSKVRDLNLTLLSISHGDSDNGSAASDGT